MTPKERQDIAELLPYAAAYLRIMAAEARIAPGFRELLHRHAETAEALAGKVGKL